MAGSSLLEYKQLVEPKGFVTVRGYENILYPTFIYWCKQSSVPCINANLNALEVGKILIAPMLFPFPLCFVLNYYIKRYRTLSGQFRCTIHEGGTACHQIHYIP